MADVAVQHGAWRMVYEPSLFGTYSKKIGMWLFLLSDSLTFGALLWPTPTAGSSTPNWPTPFHSESILNATIMTAFLLTSSLTMVLAVRASVDRKPKRNAGGCWRPWLADGFVILHGREWTNLIAEGLTLPFFRRSRDKHTAAEFANVAKTVPQFAGDIFSLTGMHMLHVTIGVIYLGVIALRKKFIPILLACWLVAWLGTPAVQPLPLRRACAAGRRRSCVRVILWLKPKVYDSSDVEVAGLYWHFVDLVWMLSSRWCT